LLYFIFKFLYLVKISDNKWKNKWYFTKERS